MRTLALADSRGIVFFSLASASGRKVVLCSSNRPACEPPPLRAKHKNHIPNVVFFAAIGEPTDSFDGSVGIFWPVQMFTPKHARRRPLGDMFKDPQDP